MKYGLVIHKETKNIGDDIQAYAASKFLPRIDYFIVREEIANFKSDNNEPVTAIANAWYMWQKWNWPPAKCIIPLIVSMHYSVSDVDVKKGESPSTDEFLSGIGADYMNAYGPIGCRDLHTLPIMQDLGIDSYFSGCLTLTLPKQPKVNVKKEYVCLVDLSPEVEKLVIEKLADLPYEIKIFSHIRLFREPEAPWDKKSKQLEERLTIYQNSKFVVTGRLHCSLPCLAMEVPVFLITPKQNSIRLKTYLDFLHYSSDAAFLAGTGYKYDFANPPENKKNYVPYREALIERTTKFIEEMENSKSDKLEDFVKTTYTDEEFYKWHSAMERVVLEKWRVVSKAQAKTISNLLKKVDDLEKGTSNIQKARRFLGKVKRKLLTK